MNKTVRLSAFVMAMSATLVQAQEKGAVLKLDAALDEIVPAGAKLEKLSDDFVYLDGRPSLEGPVWDRNANYLLFSYMAGHTISKWTPDGKISVLLHLDDPAKIPDPAIRLSNGTTLDGLGRVVYCAQTDRAIFRVEKDGRRTLLADQYEGKKLNSPNDLVYKSNGTLYFTAGGSPPEGSPSNVYLLKDGTLRGFVTPVSSPNGIAISPDETLLYVNDISKKLVWRFDIQPDDTFTNGRVFIDMNSANAIGGPDGMKVDKKGNIYDSGPGGLWILSPEGKHLGTILTPNRVSNLAFGNADGKTLYLTLHNALYRIRLNVEGVRP